MNPFLREHALPLVGSTLLHGLVAAALLAVAWYSVVPKATPPAAIEAYVARAPAPRATPAPAPVAAPAPPPAPEAVPTVPPLPDPAVAAAAERARAAAEATALAARRAEAERSEAAARTAAAQAAERREAAAAEARRKAAAAEAHRQAEAAEAKHRAEAAEAKRRADAEAAQRAARESDLARQLKSEEQRLGAEDRGLLARYVAEIQARVERAWNRPPTARPGLSCEVFVTQVPGGTVTNVRIGKCNGDAAVQQSITLAVFRASPLPAPPDPTLFERNLRLVFEPDA